MAWNNGEIDNAVGWGDISHATGIGGPPYVMGTMVDSSSSYNTMAKYKPVRHSNPGWLSYAQLQATRFGFWDPIHYTGSAPLITEAANKNNWTYLKPRGIAYDNEWFRSSDFLKEPGSTYGYNANMGCPISLECNGEPSATGFAVLVWKDSYAATRYGKSWNSEEGISITEFLAGGNNNMSGYYIAFLMCDNASPSTNFVYIITKVAINSFSTVEVFPMYGSDTYSGSVLYPGIPFLNQSHTSGITIVAGLVPNPAQSSTYPYDLTTSHSGIYSLGLIDNADRLILNFGEAYSIQGLTGGPVNNSTYPIYMGNPTNVTYAGMNFVRYQVTVGSQDGLYGLFSTPSNWGRTVSGHNTVYFDVNIINNVGTIGTSSDPGSVGTVTYTNSGSDTYPASATDQATKLLSKANCESTYLWVPTGVPLASRNFSVSCTAKAVDISQTKTMNSVQIYATA